LSGRTEDVTLNTASDNRKIIMWFALATLLMAFIVLLSFQSFRAIESSAELRMQSFELISKAEALQSELADAETGKRGYLLTGDLAYLQGYYAVRNTISTHMSELRQRTKDTEALKHLDVMAPLIDAKLAELIQTIELHRNGDAIGALAVVTKGHSKLMDDIRTEMQSYKDRQRKILLERDAKFHSKMRSLLYTIVATSLVMLSFSFVFIYLIYQRTQQKLKEIIHHETQQLLKLQEQTNKKLQDVNDALVISEEKLSVTLNSIGDAVIATDAAGRATFLNPVAEQLTGWTETEARGRPIDEIFHIISKNTRLPATIPIADALAHGTVQGLANHTILIARDSSERDIADSCAPIHNRDGQVTGAVLVFRNVSEEYAVQQALSDRSTELQRVNTKLKAWDQALNSFAIVAETDTKGKIIYANDLFCKISQYSREELLGKNHREVVSSGYHPKDFWKDMWTTISAGQRWQGEVKNHAKDGTDYWVDSIIVPLLDINGKPESYLAFRFLITERKQLNHALQEALVALQSAKILADKANLAKSDFLSSMSHELRSPLNAILGFAQLLNSESPPPSPAQKASIEQILRAGWYLLELINEILDLAVIESGRMSMSAEPVSLAGVMHECQEMMEPQAHKRMVLQSRFPDWMRLILCMRISFA
jgi:two-component system, NarL family, sensor histidine kinase EvgS